MDRRRTDRKALLEQALTVMWYFFTHFESPITGNGNACSHLQFRFQSRLKFSNCDNPVDNIPLFVTRNVLSGHELIFALLSEAVNRKQRGVLRFLERAELKAATRGERWEAEDYRTAQVVLLLAEEGAGNAYSKAFRQLFGKNAHEVRFWWRDQAKLWRLCELGGSNTPLLHANLATEPEQLIPDFDYSQVSSGGAHAERFSRLGHQENPKTASQSGPLERVSTGRPSSSPHSHPPKAPARTENRAGDSWRTR